MPAKAKNEKYFRTQVQTPQRHSLLSRNEEQKKKEAEMIDGFVNVFRWFFFAFFALRFQGCLCLVPLFLLKKKFRLSAIYHSCSFRHVMEFHSDKLHQHNEADLTTYQYDASIVPHEKSHQPQRFLLVSSHKKGRDGDKKKKCASSDAPNNFLFSLLQ